MENARWYGMLIRHAVKIVIFSPVIAPHAAALHVYEIYQIATVRCRLCNSLGRAGPSGFEQEGKRRMRGERGIQMPHSCMEITRDVKMTVRYAESRRGDITSC